LAAAIDILHLFPELTAIGQAKLQVYCDEWLRRPIAKEFGIAQIFVDEQLMLAVYLNPERAEFIDDNAFIPIDELLGYIIGQHFSDADERRDLHASVRKTRQQWGELNRDYEATIGRVGSLYLICKNPECDQIQPGSDPQQSWAGHKGARLLLVVSFDWRHPSAAALVRAIQR